MDIFLKEGTEGQEVLNIKPMHHDGAYKLCVKKETIKEGWRSWIGFADGNFNIRLTICRKSVKRTKAIEDAIRNNADKLKELWLNGQYEEMGRVIKNRIDF